MCYTYDNLSRVTATTIKNLSDDTVISTETFAYDAAGNITGGSADTAFEGVGISMGMRGADGAIYKVSQNSGKLIAQTIGNVHPTGICGSGLVDAAACMLDAEIIDESGYLEDDCCVISEPVSLNAKDIRMLQLAKNAHVLELSSNPVFSEHYMMGMLFKKV